jgi:hypothetical protein
MQQQMLQMAQVIDPAMAEQMAVGMMGGAPAAGGAGAEAQGVSGGEGEESSVTANARKRVAESTNPT